MEEEVEEPQYNPAICTEVEARGTHAGLVYDRRLKGEHKNPVLIWPTTDEILRRVGGNTGAPVIGRAAFKET